MKICPRLIASHVGNLGTIFTFLKLQCSCTGVEFDEKNLYFYLSDEMKYFDCHCFYVIYLSNLLYQSQRTHLFRDEL